MKLETWAHSRASRWLARFMLVAFLTQLSAPALLAQSYPADGYYPTGQLSDEDRERYIDRFYSDYSTWETLHQRQAEARTRQEQYEKHYAYWDQMRNYPPPRDWSGNESDWRRHVETKARQFGEYRQRNQEHVRRIGERFEQQVQRMRRHQETVEQSRDDTVRQSLGTVIGVAGISRWVAPIHATAPSATGTLRANPGRITAGEITGAVRQGGRVAARTVIGNNGTRLSNAGSNTIKWSTNTLGQSAQNAADARAALPNQGRSLMRGLFGFRQSAGAPTGATNYRVWEATPTGNANSPGRYVLRQVDVNAATGTRTPVAGGRTIPTDIAVRSQQGSRWVDNAASQRLANARAMNQQGQTQVRQGATDLRLRGRELASRTGDAAAQRAGRVMTRSGEAITARADRLDARIEQYRTDNAGAMQQRARYLAGSAARWAVFSGGMAVTTRAIESYRQSGEVDWSYATQDLRNGRFWTGTAGGFLGSMAGSALMSAVPGGPMVRAVATTFGAIGGAALGFQAGSGNLAQTDWTHLGATTVGATIGAIAFSAFGPLGTIIGGMLGHLIADKVLSMIRELGSLPAESYVYEADQDQSYSSDGGGYVGGASGGGGGDPYSGGGGPRGPPPPKPGAQVVAIKLELDRARQEFMSAQQRGDRERAMELYKRVRDLDGQLRAARSGR